VWIFLPVHSDTHINAVLNVLEKIVEIIISHIEAQVSDEQSPGLWASSNTRRLLDNVLNDQATTHKHLVVHLVNSFSSLLNFGELNISKSTRNEQWSIGNP
jgi:hypothetical protein